MDSRGPLDNRDLRVHHKANLWQVCIHGGKAANHRIYHRETRAMPGGFVEMIEHRPPSLSFVKRVPRIDLHQPWSRLVNACDLRQVHTGDVLNISSRDGLRLG